MTNKAKKKILILENDPTSGQLFLESLSRMGHEGYLARSIRDADELMANHDFHIAILDANVPNHSSGPTLVKVGFQYAFKLRQEQPQIRIAMHTCLLDQGYIEYLKSGDIGYMQKPATYEQLKELLE